MSEQDKESNFVDYWDFDQRAGEFGGFHDCPSSEKCAELKAQIQAILEAWNDNIFSHWKIPDKCFRSGREKSRFINNAMDTRNMLARILNRLDD